MTNAIFWYISMSSVNIYYNFRTSTCPFSSVHLNKIGLRHTILPKVTNNGNGLVVIIRAAHLRKNRLLIPTLLARERHRLAPAGQGAPVNHIVGTNRPVHVLLVRRHRLQRLRGMGLAVRERFRFRAAADFAHGLLAGLGRRDGAGYAVGHVGGGGGGAGQVERVFALEGDADSERFAGYGCGDWAGESAVGKSVSVDLLRCGR
jgi:hypothetical protein